MRLMSVARIGAILVAGLSLSACVADGGYYGYAETYRAPPVVYSAPAPVYVEPAPYYSRRVYRDYRYERPYHHRRPHRGYYGY